MSLLRIVLILLFSVSCAEAGPLGRGGAARSGDGAGPGMGAPVPPPVQSPAADAANAGRSGATSSAETTTVTRGSSSKASDATSAGVMPGPGDRVTMDFQGVELSQVVRFVAEMTGKNYVLDPGLKGKVTVVTPTPVSVGEAEKIFESILSVHELTVVERDGAFKIVPLKSGVAEGGTPVLQPLPTPPKEEMVLSRLVRLQFVDANSMAATLKPLLHPWGSLAAHVPTNALVVTDAAVVVNKLVILIEAMDVPVGLAERRLFRLRHASATAVEKLVNSIYTDFNTRRRKEDVGVKVFGDARSNILVVVCPKEQVKEIENLVAGLDHPVVSTSGNLHLYYPRNSEAEAIAKVLTSLMGTSNAAKAGGEELKPLEFMRSVNVVGEKSTNTLVIAATPEDYRTLLPIIQGLDKRRLQVHVEALIIEVTAERAAEFGVEWRFGNIPTTPGSKAVTGFGGSSFGEAITNPLDMGNGMALGLMKGTITWGTTTVPNIPALIKAFQSEGDVNILATPNIVTMDGIESEIIVGQNIPIVSGTTTSTAATATTTPGVTSQTVERKDVGLTLRVTPRIIEDEWLEMKIYQEQSSITPKSMDQLNAGTLGSSVVTNKRSIKTTVNLKSGNTIVLGGLIKEEQSDQVGMVPCLGGVSGVGELFKKTSRSRNKSNLMVFIRPVITNQFDELVKISSDKYQAAREIWGAAESKGSDVIRTLPPSTLPEFDRILPYVPPKEEDKAGQRGEIDAKPVHDDKKPVHKTESTVRPEDAPLKRAPAVKKEELPEKRSSVKKEDLSEKRSVVKPVKAEPSAAAVESAVEGAGDVPVARAVDGYALQVEYGDNLEGARETAGKWIAKGYAASVVRELDRDGKPRYSVRIGHYAAEKDAQRAASEFKKKEGKSVYPIRWRPAIEGN
ncbi:MAG: type II secretion system secretin GspD [Magnetococcus sp. YQC-9]